MIFGAVGTAIALLNLARQGFDSLLTISKDIRSAGQTIVDIKRQFDNIYFLIKQWEKFWITDSPTTTDEELIVFWGEEGWRLIRQQLDTIDAKCKDLAALLKPFLSADHAHSISDHEWEIARARLETRAPPQAHVTNATTLGKKAKFVLKASDKLRNYLKSLQDESNQLQRIVDDAWREQHPTVDWKVSTHQQRWLIALKETRSPIARAAKRDRKEIMDLHPFCLRTMEALDLELNLLKNTAEIPRVRCFHMIRAWPPGGVHFQVCAELAKEVLPEVARTCCTAFSDACKIAMRRGECVFRTTTMVPTHQLRLSEPPPVHFNLRRSSPHLYPNQYSKFSLSRKLEHMLIAERLDLAYKVVESSLLLLDTPWLSALGSRTISRFERSGELPKYVLGIGEGIQDSVQQRLPEGIGSLNLHIFAIGVLLIELALATVVSHVEIYKSTVCLVKTESKNLRLSSLRRAISQVRNEMGALYAEAVEFCLQDPTTAPNRAWAEGVMYDPTANEEEISEELLGLFYTNVFLK